MGVQPTYSKSTYVRRGVTKGKLLQIIMHHQIHHRAQLGVLMRIAGLAVLGVYGPSKEDWTAMGMAPMQ